MDIVCNIDSNYIKYCVVTLVSLFHNNERGSVHAHIVAGKLSENEKMIIREELEAYGNQLTFYDAGDTIVANCPISDETNRLSVATYYRIFLPVILPQSISKVLYLDCDLVVESSIAELWRIPLEGYALGAAEDCSCGMDEIYDRLHYAREYSYFNAGVLLLNLDFWRKNHVLEKCIQYIQKYPERLKFNDQDVLNGVLFAQWKRLPYKWNMHYYFRKTTVMTDEAIKEIRPFLLFPSVLHYISGSKPWLPHCEHPLVGRWFHYLDQTRWRGERPRKTFKDFFNHYIKPIGYLIGVDKPRYKYVRFKKT